MSGPARLSAPLMALLVAGVPACYGPLVDDCTPRFGGRAAHLRHPRRRDPVVLGHEHGGAARGGDAVGDADDLTATDHLAARWLANRCGRWQPHVRRPGRLESLVLGRQLLRRAR